MDMRTAPQIRKDDIAPGAEVVKVGEFVAGSPEWLAARRQGIGGSDVAAILGFSPWLTPYEVFLDKRGELQAQEDSGGLEWGRRLEPILRQAYADRTGFSVATLPMLRSLRYPFMLANLDGLAITGCDPDARRVVEFKTAYSDSHWGPDGTDGVPMYYVLQVQHYLAITGLARADVAVLIAGSDFRVLHIEADAELQDLLITAEQAFWDRVENDDPPPPTNLADVRRRWGSASDRGLLAASAEDIEVVTNLRETTALMKELTANEEASRKLLMERLATAGADTLVDPEGKPLCTWKLPAAPRRFDEQAFAANEPELFKAYMRTGKASRRFLLR